MEEVKTEKVEKKKVKALIVEDKPTQDKKEKKEDEDSIVVDVVRNMVCKPSKYTLYLNRRIKMTPSFERPFLIKDDDTDYTPKRIAGPGHPRWVSDPAIFTFPSEAPHEVPEVMLKSLTSMANLIGSQINVRMREDLAEKKVEEVQSLTPAPSMFHLVIPGETPLDRKKIIINLKETDTIMLLEIDSVAAEVGEDEAELIANRNKFVQEEKKRLKKLYDNFSMTVNAVPKSISSNISRCRRINSSTFASNWTMYEVEKEQEVKIEVPRIRLRIGKVTEIIYKEVESVIVPIQLPNFKVTRPIIFYTAAQIMERVLLSNNAWKRQLVFHDLLKCEALDPNVEFKYHLLKLWTLTTPETEGRPVTSMSWNVHKPNILAVGYGKFTYLDGGNGLVYIWNNKNLANPERRFTFKYLVTSLQFSKVYPNILAVSFYSGLVLLINIEKYGTKIISQNMDMNVTCAYPVWRVIWITEKALKVDWLVECTGNGCVYKYNDRYLYDKNLIMKISKMKGLLKGVEHPKKCQPYVIPLVRHPGVLCIAPHPLDAEIYYIGSEEGTVYKCAFHDVHQHLDMFIAHNGPVYSIEFHPACPKIFLTCGADWYIRVWGDGIFSPLITMISGMSSIQSAYWCPNNPTLVANISGSKIELWDISRKIILPQSSTKNPTGALNTTICFSTDGNNLCVGDANGCVNIYAFKDMPFDPLYPDMVLALALTKALVPKPKLLAELKKLGPPFSVTKRYKLKSPAV